MIKKVVTIPRDGVLPEKEVYIYDCIPNKIYAFKDEYYNGVIRILQQDGLNSKVYRWSNFSADAGEGVSTYDGFWGAIEYCEFRLEKEPIFQFDTQEEFFNWAIGQILGKK